MNEPQQRWAGLKYVQVPGLANRIIARYLRTQRKNMRAFFASRGMHDQLERMDQIRKSRQGMIAKNRMFQEVLTAYATQTMQAQTQVPGSMEPLQDVRSTEGQEMATATPRVREVALDRVEDPEPRAYEGDQLQIAGISDSDPIIEE